MHGNFLPLEGIAIYLHIKQHVYEIVSLDNVYAISTMIQSYKGYFSLENY